MSIRLISENCRIEKYGVKEEWNCHYFTNEGFLIKQIDALDSVGEDHLLKNNFRFLDRILYIETATRNCDMSNPYVPPDTYIVCDCDYCKEIYEVAYQGYTTDRRFHLETIFNQKLANSIIKMYIDLFQGNGLKIYKAFHKTELLGYTIVDEKEDGKSFENVLGVTKPGIKGKMVAPVLYQTMIAEEKKLGFEKYAARVSSSNAASINLHFNLGGKIVSIYDEFIIKQNQ